MQVDYFDMTNEREILNFRRTNGTSSKMNIKRPSFVIWGLPALHMV